MDAEAMTAGMKRKAWCYSSSLPRDFKAADSRLREKSLIRREVQTRREVQRYTWTRKEATDEHNIRRRAGVKVRSAHKVGVNKGGG